MEPYFTQAREKERRKGREVVGKEKGKRKGGGKEVSVWTDCPLLGPQVAELNGKKEDTAGGGTFPQDRVRRGETLGRGGCSSPDREHCVDSGVPCWPSRSRADKAAGELLPARKRKQGELESQSPWRVRDSPSSLGCQHIFSVHLSDMCWLFTVSVCCHWFILSSTTYIHIYTSPLSVQTLISKGVKVIKWKCKNTLYILLYSQ